MLAVGVEAPEASPLDPTLGLTVNLNGAAEVGGGVDGGGVDAADDVAEDEADFGELLWRGSRGIGNLAARGLP